MSRSDFPPGYDESRPLSNPHGGAPAPSAPPPAYDYSPYGGHPQPGPYPGPPYSQPSAPYPGQPGMYPPQPGLPGQGYPAQPGHPGQGYPPQMPPIIPPVMPMPDSGDDGFTTTGGWESVDIRHAFIRKVYLILAAQLLVTVGIVAVFTFVQPVKNFVIKNPAVYWVSYAVYIITHLVLVCCKGPRRRFPWNLILLSLFTLALSYMTGTISSYYETKSVFLALGITVLVCIAVTVFCFQTKVDFTKCGGLFCVLGIVVFVTGIITAIVLSFKYIPWLHMLYAAIGAIVFTLFLAYHTQLLIGNRKHSISPEEYVFAALSIYVDVIQIFLFLLQIIGASQR
ncbi:transmembrane BAX inhibitor motif containing 1a isoform 1-T2 [Clarias gariepinus]|uniref:transmembrane BAX inhibitor motif containing 1a n=1 Tax=Clarias gariepinus TaxID=13013 RepID=UPI00234C461B|nr:transmembrane BAX inhibitor motif containing 1a [Clarias gariepinus]XP_053354120.1 transmembrane BAX inhibitor motif containing 1a [Clarias gariepinus]